MRPTISEIKSSTALNNDSTMSRKQISLSHSLQKSVATLKTTFQKVQYNINIVLVPYTSSLLSEFYIAWFGLLLSRQN